MHSPTNKTEQGAYLHNYSKTASSYLYYNHSPDVEWSFDVECKFCFQCGCSPHLHWSRLKQCITMPNIVQDHLCKTSVVSKSRSKLCLTHMCIMVFFHFLYQITSILRFLSIMSNNQFDISVNKYFSEQVSKGQQNKTINRYPWTNPSM